MSIQEKYADMDVPAFHLTGWYDDLTHETISNFVNMRKLSRSDHARRWQKLLVGPWGHGVRSDPKYGDMDFGPKMADRLTEAPLAVVRLSPEGHAERARQGSADPDLRDGSERLA